MESKILHNNKLPLWIQTSLQTVLSTLSMINASLTLILNHSVNIGNDKLAGHSDKLIWLLQGYNIPTDKYLRD